ncbi:unnamed protein product [Urochloa humidicola]
MLASTCLSPSFFPTPTVTATHGPLTISGNSGNRRPLRHMSGGGFVLHARLSDADGDGGGELAPSRRHAVLAVARVAFALVNAPCLRYMNQAALGRSCTGNACGDLLVGAMAHSWRMLVQGLTSLMFLCARAEEYVRPPPSPLVLMAHDKPASHPQQVRISVVGANSMRISWVTDDRRAPSVVEYGTSPGKYMASATGDHTMYHYFFYKSGAIHHATIGPLDPGTTYYYRCSMAGNEFRLRTPPATLPIEFVVIVLLGVYAGKLLACFWRRGISALFSWQGKPCSRGRGEASRAREPNWPSVSTWGETQFWHPPRVRKRTGKVREIRMETYWGTVTAETCQQTRVCRSHAF